MTNVVYALIVRDEDPVRRARLDDLLAGVLTIPDTPEAIPEDVLDGRPNSSLTLEELKARQDRLRDVWGATPVARQGLDATRNLADDARRMG